jgi:fumarylpyruvate hydrolase
VIPPAGQVSLPVNGLEERFPVRRCYCVGQNYAEHAREMGASGRAAPFFFSKPAGAVCTGPHIPYPGRTGELHHEVELVVALARGGSEVPVDQASGLIFGYAVGVDLTRRDLQAAAKKKGRPWTTAKGFDYSAPISPILPLADGTHPFENAISLEVNGQLRQQGSTAQMIWSVPEILSELSGYFHLAPGDLVFTGTPAGVGPLEPGDHVQCRIEGVGQLAFTMVQAAR